MSTERDLLSDQETTEDYERYREALELMVQAQRERDRLRDAILEHKAQVMMGAVSESHVAEADEALWAELSGPFDDSRRATEEPS